jgi:CDP-diacylglycerol--serine O-phosphatidyltransferase
MKMQKIKIQGTVHILPNLFTTANLAMGIYAITLVLKEDCNYGAAGLAIFFAMLLDVFDGLIARVTKTTSRFGMELDSLADMVSFGVAPAIMVYNKALSMFDSVHYKQVGRIGFFICVVYAGCAALRLARFNSQIEDESKSFSGIPTPAAAGVIISYFMMLEKGIVPDFMSQFTTQWILPIVTFCLGILMVSNIRFPAPAKKILWKQHPFIYLALFAGLLVLVITNTGLTLFIIFITYVLYGLVTHLRSRLLKQTTPALQPTIGEQADDTEE